MWNRLNGWVLSFLMNVVAKINEGRRFKMLKEEQENKFKNK